MSKLSIFDVDKTLAHCNVSFAFGKYLYKKKFFSLLKMLGLVLCYAMHVIKILPLQALHQISFYFLFYKASKNEIERLAQEFIDLEANSLIRKELELKLFQLKDLRIDLKAMASAYIPSLAQMSFLQRNTNLMQAVDLQRF